MRTVDPEFARRAADLLAAGDVEGALTLARDGVERYPRYLSGFRVLAQCLQAKGATNEAILALEEAQKFLPDVPGTRDVIAALKAISAGAVSLTNKNRPLIDPGPREDDFEALARRIGAAEPIRSEPPAAAPRSEEAEDSMALDSGRVVSATFAEILVQQGQLAEAIRMFRILSEREEDGIQKFGARLEELEEKLRQQLFEG